MLNLYVHIPRDGVALIYIDIPIIQEFECPKLLFNPTFRRVSMLHTLSFNELVHESHVPFGMTKSNLECQCTTLIQKTGIYIPVHILTFSYGQGNLPLMFHVLDVFVLC